jgi:DNA-binding GntR family transcriptional regulator
MQLAAILRPLVTAMEPNQPLPSLARLCQEYGVSPKTARRSLAVLESEGLVYIRASRGAFRAG